MTCLKSNYLFRFFSQKIKIKKKKISKTKYFDLNLPEKVNAQVKTGKKVLVKAILKYVVKNNWLRLKMNLLKA